MRILPLLAFIGCASTHAAATTPAAAEEWPTPPGWRSETIPFPLEFAPALPYRGVEQLRFAPGFFDPASPTYFTYAFVWIVDGTPSFDDLGAELGTYFAGLASAVSAKRVDPSAHRASLTRLGSGLRGTVETVDAFGDGHAIRLSVDGDVVRCGGRTVLRLGLTPRDDDAVRAMLERQRRAFHCGS